MPLTNVLLLAICGAIVVLGSGYPFVASGVSNDRLGRVSQQGARYPDELMDRASPAFRAPQIKRLTAARPRQIELADPSLAATAAKRKQLTYLVRCALPPDVELYAQYGSECFTFPGSIGLAPHWLTQAMTQAKNDGSQRASWRMSIISGNMCGFRSVPTVLPCPNSKPPTMSARPTPLRKVASLAIFFSPSPLLIPA
jgi:hypothetical protein